jgi:HAD superfamily hydrolase (TIGR01509 family)
MKALVIDFSRVLIFARADVPSLGRHHDQLSPTPGYRPLEHFSLNTELLTFLHDLNASVPVYLFTDGRLHTVPEISPALEGVFRSIIKVEDLGYKKSQAEAYLTLAYRLGFAPADALFVDDKPANIEAAIAAGYAVRLYVSNDDLVRYINQILI